MSCQSQGSYVGKVAVHSGELVWGLCTVGAFWWHPDTGRAILCPGSDFVHGLGLELYESANLCPEHGLEGQLVGFATDYMMGFRWLEGQSVPVKRPE